MRPLGPRPETVHVPSGLEYLSQADEKTPHAFSAIAQHPAPLRDRPPRGGEAANCLYRSQVCTRSPERHVSVPASPSSSSLPAPPYRWALPRSPSRSSLPPAPQIQSFPPPTLDVVGATARLDHVATWRAMEFIRARCAYDCCRTARASRTASVRGIAERCRDQKNSPESQDERRREGDRSTNAHRGHRRSPS